MLRLKECCKFFVNKADNNDDGDDYDGDDDDGDDDDDYDGDDDVVRGAVFEDKGVTVTRQK